MTPETNSAARTDDEYLVLGRILMDQGFRDLFRQYPERAAAELGISLSPEAFERIRGGLSKMGAMDTRARGEFTSKLNSVERWKQA